MAIKAATWRRRLVRHLSPPVLLALIYAGLIWLGTMLLMLPFAHDLPLTLSDALFTAVSAVTVTGLSVVDPGSTFSTFGEAVLLVLMQLGGLGLMTFAVLLLSALGMRVSLSQQMVLRDDLGQSSLGHLGQLSRMVITIALTCELVGAILLAFAFVPVFGLSEGLWQAVFHSISAFNNAGFQLSSDGLARWVESPLVNLTVPALFMLGGIGFVVIMDVAQKRQWRTLTLHSKLMLSGSAGLVVLMFAVMLAFEWSNPRTLGQFASPVERIWAAWFQAVTPRTAGFNSIDVAGLHDSTSLMMIVMMLIGGGSTSTAGGIKVTTILVALLATVAFFKQRTTLHIFGRSLGMEEVMKAMALTTISMLVVTVALFLLVIAHDGEFLDLAFEVASAFGTVGLTRGTTGELDGFGRAIIMAVMFIGRVGPLTLGFLLATRRTPRVQYPTGTIHIG